MHYSDVRAGLAFPLDRRDNSNSTLLGRVAGDWPRRLAWRAGTPGSMWVPVRRRSPDNAQRSTRVSAAPAPKAQDRALPALALGIAQTPCEVRASAIGKSSASLKMLFVTRIIRGGRG